MCIATTWAKIDVSEGETFYPNPTKLNKQALYEMNAANE